MRVNFRFFSFIFFIFGVAIFNPIFCQKEYLPGYVIKKNGDTIRGLIDYRNWEGSPDRIFFKETQVDKRVSFSPIDLNGFGVSDEIYKSAIIETEVSPEQTKYLQYNPAVQLEKDTTFLQTMISGGKSLYYYKNKIGKHQFYIKQDSSLVLLLFKSFLKEEDNRTIILHKNTYLGQLQLYLNDCKGIGSQIETVKYEKNSLESLFEFYYHCMNTEIPFQKKTEKASTEFGALAGMTLTSLKFSSSDFPYLVNAHYNLSPNFTAGLFLDVILRRNMNKWSVNNELMFTSYKVNGQYEEYINENKYSTTYTTIGYSYIKMNNMLRFKFPAGKIFIFINGGISTGIVVIEKNYMKEESTFYTMHRVTEGEAIDDPRKFEVGFNLGSGAKYKKFSFEFRYEWGNGMSGYVSLKSVTSRYYFLLGYRFL